MTLAYLGIDIGTFETKGVAVTSDGRVLAEARRPHKMSVPQSGWAEHDAEAIWWGEVADIAREITAAPEIDAAQIRAVGVSGIGPCMLPVDAEGTPLMNAVLYGVDTRATAEVAELTEQIGTDRLLADGGNPLTSQAVGPKILWLRRNRPEIFAKTDKIMNSSSFVVRRLTGRTVIDHYSGCGTTPLYDVAANAWRDDFTGTICGPDLLPELLWTTDIAGEVTREAAEATGLKAGTPVIAGTIDAGAEAVSIGATKPGTMMLMYGSTIFIIQVTADRVSDESLWYSPWLFPGRHASMAGLATSGTLTHWFRDQFAREMAPEAAMQALAQEAASAPPGANGITMLPYFSGERTPINDPDARGVIFGLDLTHTRADLYRGLLEGIAYGVHHVLETYAAIGHRPAEIRAVGGGVQNQVWSQAVSDVAQRSQMVPQQTRGASYGDAFLAALGVGDVAEDDIAQWNPMAREIAPDPSLAALYRAGFDRYRAIYERTKDLMQASPR